MVYIVTDKIIGGTWIIGDRGHDSIIDDRYYINLQNGCGCVLPTFDNIRTESDDYIIEVKQKDN